MYVSVRLHYLPMPDRTSEFAPKLPLTSHAIVSANPEHFL
jgi:hypothetical protein